ncbi:hypothetical protein PCH_Pc21g16290 [Penicillium rubens Wisconsin 54-1255]|uniref:Uncharacterized protein n=1 Tax=Penicillium rubens (strain ATCC 28089 / DSM 1075 / NRRL 1951 / Wisconsin 54-1255) TaxID=500485 RepID=B6HKY7_PENRW|nr:hypothetical protein PCH_Pc21g16290 [Penicillium rubens Wisconsin 54-1255]
MGSKTIKLSMYAYCGHHARNGEVRVDYLRVDYFQGYAPTRWCKDWQYRVIIERAKHSAALLALESDGDLTYKKPEYRPNSYIVIGTRPLTRHLSMLGVDTPLPEACPPRIVIRMLVSGMRSSVETALLVLLSEISIDSAAKAS